MSLALDFPNNALTDECIDVLTKAMLNKKIKILNLSNNKIGNEGAKNLAIFVSTHLYRIVYLAKNLSRNLSVWQKPGRYFCHHIYITGYVCRHIPCLNLR